MRRKWLREFKSGNSQFEIVCVLGCLLFLLAGCQKPAQVPEGPKSAPQEPKPTVEPQKAEPSKPTPKIAFENMVHDYGDVGPGTDNVGEFKFTNVGEGLLTIKEVKGCCGVTTSLEKQQYEPGESGVVKAKFRAFTAPGTFRRAIQVYSNDPSKAEVELTLKARIVPKVAYEPQRLNLLLRDKDARSPEITLTSLDGKPFSITQFRSTLNSVTADIDPAVQATKFILKPKIDAQKLQEGVDGYIQISLTHPQCSQVSIPFSAVPRFKITPQQLIVLKAEPKKPVIRKVWVLSNYGDAFEVESASSQNGIVKVLKQEKVGSGYQFEVEITPPETKDQGRFTDTFVVNLTGGEKLAIVCRGFY